MHISKQQTQQIVNYRKYLTYHLQLKYPHLPYQDIEDVVQSSIIKCLETIDPKQFNKYKSFLITIANNLVIDIFRKNYRHKETNLNDYLNLPIDDFSPEYCSNLFNQKLLNSLLIDLKDNINVKVFLESKLNQMSYSELASKYNTTEPCIRKRIERAKKMLNKKYLEISNDLL
jgi:RNA polymerase sigma factor (sigma-70 family)